MFHLYFFLQFLIIKTLDLDPHSLKMLDPDPYPDSMNPNPHYCFIFALLSEVVVIIIKLDISTAMCLS
jgi:hypothetical protein